MAHSSKTCALSSRKYISELGNSIPDLLEKLRVFWSHCSVFALEKNLKNGNFRNFIPLKETLVATFNETRATTFRKYVPESCILMPNLSQTNKSF